MKFTYANLEHNQLELVKGAGLGSGPLGAENSARFRSEVCESLHLPLAALRVPDVKMRSEKWANVRFTLPLWWLIEVSQR